jgi:hypothetical protein
MQLIGELLARGKKSPDKGGFFAPTHSLFRRQVR